LHSGFIIGKVNAVFFLKFVNEVVNDRAVKISTTKVGITVC